MKAKSRTFVLSLITSGTVLAAFSQEGWAQQPPPPPSAAPVLSASPPSGTPQPSAPTVLPAEDASTPRAAVADKPAGSSDAQVNPTVSAAPEASGNATFAPLAPIPQDTLAKKKGKKKDKKKGKAARAAAEFGEAGTEDADDSWGDPWGDSQDELRAAGLSFRFLAQTHYQYTHVTPSKNPLEDHRAPEEQIAHNNDGWDVNRLFFRIAAEPSKYLRLKMITDFAEFKHGNGKKAIKQAYVELSPLPKHIHVLAGVLKLPYSITELDPIAKYEFTSLGQANDLAKKLDFSGRDIGAELMVTPLAKPRYLRAVFGVFQGHSQNENASVVGAIGARVESSPIKQLRIGADWVEQPKSVTYYEYFDISDKSLMPNPDNPYAPIAQKWVKGQAFSGDITFESAGFLLRTEAMYGSRIDYYTRYGAENFVAYWASASYKFPVGSLKLQPGLRVEWLDTDTQHKIGLRRQLTAGFGTYFSPKVRLLIDVTRTDVQDGTPVVNQPDPLPVEPYNALSSTRVTTQLQVVL